MLFPKYAPYHQARLNVTRLLHDLDYSLLGPEENLKEKILTLPSEGPDSGLSLLIAIYNTFIALITRSEIYSARYKTTHSVLHNFSTPELVEKIIGQFNNLIQNDSQLWSQYIGEPEVQFMLIYLLENYYDDSECLLGHLYKNKDHLSREVLSTFQCLHPDDSDSDLDESLALYEIDAEFNKSTPTEALHQLLDIKRITYLDALPVWLKTLTKIRINLLIFSNIIKYCQTNEEITGCISIIEHSSINLDINFAHEQINPSNRFSSLFVWTIVIERFFKQFLTEDLQDEKLILEQLKLNLLNKVKPDTLLSHDELSYLDYSFYVCLIYAANGQEILLLQTPENLSRIIYLFVTSHYSNKNKQTFQLRNKYDECIQENLISCMHSTLNNLRCDELISLSETLSGFINASKKKTVSPLDELQNLHVFCRLLNNLIELQHHVSVSKFDLNLYLSPKICKPISGLLSFQNVINQANTIVGNFFQWATTTLYFDDDPKKYTETLNLVFENYNYFQADQASLGFCTKLFQQFETNRYLQLPKKEMPIKHKKQKPKKQSEVEINVNRLMITEPMKELDEYQCNSSAAFFKPEKSNKTTSSRYLIKADQIPDIIVAFLNQVRDIYGNRVFLIGGALSDHLLGRNIPCCNDFDFIFPGVDLDCLQTIISSELFKESENNISSKLLGQHESKIIQIELTDKNNKTFSIDIKSCPETDTYIANNIKNYLQKNGDFNHSALFMEIDHNTTYILKSALGDGDIEKLSLHSISLINPRVSFFIEKPICLFRLAKILLKYPNLKLSHDVQEAIDYFFQEQGFHHPTLNLSSDKRLQGQISTAFNQLLLRFPTSDVLSILNKLNIMYLLTGFHESEINLLSNILVGCLKENNLPANMHGHSTTKTYLFCCLYAFYLLSDKQSSDTTARWPFHWILQTVRPAIPLYKIINDKCKLLDQIMYEDLFLDRLINKIHTEMNMEPTKNSSPGTPGLKS